LFPSFQPNRLQRLSEGQVVAGEYVVLLFLKWGPDQTVFADKNRLEIRATCMSDPRANIYPARRHFAAALARHHASRRYLPLFMPPIDSPSTKLFTLIGMVGDLLSQNKPLPVII
jgi:hypothetical protein